MILSILLVCFFTLYGEEKNFISSYWQKFFTEPCEIVYFIMKDDTPFRISSGSVKSIYVPIEELKKRLKNEKEAYEIKDIAIVIHNHRTKPRFLQADWKFYRNFKRRGFNGQFLMYCHRTNKVYDIEDKGESK